MKLSTLHESNGLEKSRKQPKFSADVPWIFGGPKQERSKHPTRWYYGQPKKGPAYRPAKKPFTGKAEGTRGRGPGRRVDRATEPSSRRRTSTPGGLVLPGSGRGAGSPSPRIRSLMPIVNADR